MSDSDLMLAFQKGTVDAFEELFRRYEQPIWRYFRRRVVDPARAEELMQETFLAVLRGAAKYEPTATFRTYIYSIAFNLLSADRRARQSETIEALQSIPTSRSALDDQLWLRQAIGRLDAMDRDVLMLREFEQLSYQEIADVLQILKNTVRSRLFRARAALRERLEPGLAVKGRDS